MLQQHLIFLVFLCQKGGNKKFVSLRRAHGVPGDPWQPLPTSSDSIQTLLKRPRAAGRGSFPRPGLLAAQEEGAGAAELNKAVFVLHNSVRRSLELVLARAQAGQAVKMNDQADDPKGR